MSKMSIKLNEKHLLSEKEKERITWGQILGIVSHTTDSLYEDLSKTFHDTKYQFLEEHRIFL